MEHDLFVWLDESGQPSGFQLSYNKTHTEHVINWFLDRGYSHDKVDSGEDKQGNYKMTPIMVPDGEFESEKIAAEFISISTEMDADISSFILEKLLDYPS
ncbi:MAG: hypothetical protein OEY43_04010 [Gammaproteobacteria bacterium]|nr:hypothetical protein [Gammaproteobacteria bacterium]